MSFEDLPKKPAGVMLGENLDLLSVAELEHRVSQLESEILRVKAGIQERRRRLFSLLSISIWHNCASRVASVKVSVRSLRYSLECNP